MVVLLVDVPKALEYRPRDPFSKRILLFAAAAAAAAVGGGVPQLLVETLVLHGP